MQPWQLNKMRLTHGGLAGCWRMKKRKYCCLAVLHDIRGVVRHQKKIGERGEGRRERGEGRGEK